MPQLNATRVTPAITATDIEASIRFYTGGLGFEVASHSDVDGVLQYVTLKAGVAEIGIGRDDFAKGADRVKGVGVRIWFTTDQDLTLLSEQVKAAGYTLDNDPARLPWGPMAFAVTDPDGIKVTVTNET
jgi:catechol 2,3-dioxygenase-like lactoylglutathione lyase family enzyme